MTTSRWIVGALLAVMLVGVSLRPVRAQSEMIPHDVAALLDNVDDMDELRSLNPLKLTSDQVDKLITTIKKSQDDFNQKVGSSIIGPLRDLAKEIQEAHKKALLGENIPKALDDKIKKLQTAFIDRRSQEEKNTLKSLSADIRKILTAEQVDAAIAEAKKVVHVDKPDKDALFNTYVLQVFIKYRRAIPLLEDLKKAKSPATGTSSSPGGGL